MRRLRIFASVVIAVLLFSAAPRQAEAMDAWTWVCLTGCTIATTNACGDYNYDPASCAIYFGACVASCSMH